MTNEKEAHNAASPQGDWKPEKDWEGLQVNEGLQAATESDMAVHNQRSELRSIKTVQFQTGRPGVQVTLANPVPQQRGTWMRLEEDHERDGRRVLGLRAPIFWMLVVVFVLVLSGGIGGGVAASLSTQKKQSTASSFTASPFLAPTAAGAAASTSAPSSTTTPTSTNSAAAPGVSPSLASPCDRSPSANGTIMTASDTSGNPSALNRVPHVFTLLCNTGYPAGGVFGNPKLVDLMVIYPSPLNMQGCIDACVQYNFGAAVAGGAPSCKAVAITKTPGGWCYFKSAVGVNNTSSSPGVAIDTAVLLGV